MAEKLAGIKLVIARSFERLYRQNADNIGLFTSTDFSLVERIRQGQPIYIEELLAGRDRLAAAILSRGGLLAFGKMHMRSIAHSKRANDRPRTFFAKIIDRHGFYTDFHRACQIGMEK